MTTKTKRFAHQQIAAAREKRRAAGEMMALPKAATRPGDFLIVMRDDTMSGKLPAGSHAVCRLVRETKPSAFRVDQVLFVRRTRPDGLWSDALLRVAAVEKQRLRLETDDPALERQRRFTYPSKRGEPHMDIVAQAVAVVLDLP